MKKRLTLRQAVYLHRQLWGKLAKARILNKNVVCKLVNLGSKRTDFESIFNSCFFCQYAMQEQALAKKGFSQPICTHCPVDWKQEVDLAPLCMSSEVFPYSTWLVLHNWEKEERAEIAERIRGMVPKKWNYGRYSW